MEILLLLLIAHLLGDFLFQTNRIFAWKQRSFWGIVTHTSIVSLSIIAVLLPYLAHWQVWSAIFINFLLHTAQDRIKLRFPTFHGSPIGPYLIDQIVHIGVLVAISSTLLDLPPTLFQEREWSEFFQNTTLLFYILGLLFSSYFLDITLFVFQYKKNAPTAHRRKYRAMLFRTTLFTIGFLILFALRH